MLDAERRHAVIQAQHRLHSVERQYASVDRPQIAESFPGQVIVGNGHPHRPPSERIGREGIRDELKATSSNRRAGPDNPALRNK